jgi:pimeloyl-ACP methyl ester carboxylesterase
MTETLKHPNKASWSRKLAWFLAVVLLLAAAGVAAMVFVTHRVKGVYFDSNGVRIYYTDEGRGEPVVLIHGFAVNADLNWRLPGITEFLAKDFRVIAMDLRGHGLSGKPHAAEKYGLQMANDVINLLDHLQIKKAHVVGYSLGGLIALKLAATHPQRLLSAFPCGAGWERPNNAAFLGAMERLAADLAAGRGIKPLSGNLGAGRQKPGWLHTAWVKIMTRYFNDPLALAAMVRGIPGLTLKEAELQGITVPVCSIIGSRDPLKAGVDAMNGRVNDFTVIVVPDADHIRTPGTEKMHRALKQFLLSHRERRPD